MQGLILCDKFFSFLLLTGYNSMVAASDPAQTLFILSWHAHVTFDLMETQWKLIFELALLPRENC